MLRRVDLRTDLVDWVEHETGATVVRSRRNFGGGSRATWFVDAERAGEPLVLVVREESGEGAFSGIPGPFFTSGSVGGPLTFTFSGPPSSGVILAMASLNRTNVVFPGVGSLDIGLLGLNLSDVIVLLDGVSGSSFLDQLATTGPLGSATLGFTIPALPLGIAGTFQAAVVAPAQPPVLTAAFQLTIN